VDVNATGGNNDRIHEGGLVGTMGLVVMGPNNGSDSLGVWGGEGLGKPEALGGKQSCCEYVTEGGVGAGGGEDIVFADGRSPGGGGTLSSSE